MSRARDEETLCEVVVLQGELAPECAVTPSDCARTAYQAARNYAEGYEPSLGTGLVPGSAPRLEEIIAFWLTEAA